MTLARQPDIRSDMLAKRRSLDTRFHHETSDRIFSRLRDAWLRESIPGALDIGVYRSMPDETRVDPVSVWLAREGHRLYFPRIVDLDRGEMEWVHAQITVQEEWAPGSFGLLEPCDRITGERLPALDVIFVPGVAFGENGERVGMGKGFYDRMLGRLPRALRVALAYDFQVLPEISQHPWDQRVHWIITECRELQACSVRDRVGQLLR